MTDEEIEGIVSLCIINMVQSMMTWREDLQCLFNTRYRAQFCLNCGRPKRYYKNLPSPCRCEEDAF